MDQIIAASRLTGAMSAIKAAMKVIAGASESDGRKSLPDKLNAVARQAGIKLTQGNISSVSKDTLDKWCAPTDTASAICSHTASLVCGYR